VTRLRAWSGITGWRFESSSAHSRKPYPLSGAFVVSRPVALGGAGSSWQRSRAIAPLPRTLPELDYLRIDRDPAVPGRVRAALPATGGVPHRNGARISEVLAVTWADVDLADCVVRIRASAPAAVISPCRRRTGAYAPSTSAEAWPRASRCSVRSALTQASMTPADCSLPGSQARPLRPPHPPAPPSRKTVHEWHDPRATACRATRHHAPCPAAHGGRRLAQPRTTAHTRHATARAQVDHHD
jgi:hypothetical protein